MVERLERARRALAADAALRGEIDRWVKARVIEAVERHHDRLAAFIEKGVLALGPEGAVRLIEEHAGDDLQYIRVNGTVVGGLAGGLLYAVHLLLRLGLTSGGAAPISHSPPSTPARHPPGIGGAGRAHAPNLKPLRPPPGARPVEPTSPPAH